MTPSQPAKKFVITGGIPLQGTVAVSGSKNAALPILAAALLSKEKSTLKNVPNIADVHTMLELLAAVGAKVMYRNHTVTIDPSDLHYAPLGHEVCHLRGSIVLLAPLLHRFHEVEMAFPGGCVLGRRSISAHIDALTQFGAEVIRNKDRLHMRAPALHAVPNLIMSQMSVTATENAIMAASVAEGRTTIELAACEPHVQDLCRFLNTMGARIEGIGTQTLVIEGTALHGTEYSITGDYLEAATFVLAGALTGGNVTVTGFDPSHLESFWLKLQQAGITVEREADRVMLHPPHTLQQLHGPWLDTRVFPGFSTDLQAPFAVLLTQLPGETKIFETLFEGRLVYLAELEKMGAKVEILNPHQAIINGPTPLKGATVSSCDIRAGAAVVLAGLIAEGTTTIYDINYTDRGYEEFDVKLRNLGADIQRVNE